MRNGQDDSDPRRMEGVVGGKSYTLKDDFTKKAGMKKLKQWFGDKTDKSEAEIESDSDSSDPADWK